VDQTTSIGQNRAAIILAGGDGTRLRELTERIAGFYIPKQFCALLGETTLLEETRRRVSLSIPSDLTFFALNRDHEGFFSPLLATSSHRTLWCSLETEVPLLRSFSPCYASR
jgi:mannose-1-phosphate guanylyltransferase